MSPSYPTYSDDVLLELFSEGDVKAFEAIYERYVSPLYNYIESRIQSREDSKEIVQEIFETLWMQRESLAIHTSFKRYLFGSAKHQILNYFRSEKIQQKYVEHFTHFVAQRHESSTEEMTNLADLEKTIETSIARLPGKCQAIFRMSRMDHLPIQEIARRMNVSSRTVENNISIALKHLRNSIGELMVVAIGVVGI